MSTESEKRYRWFAGAASLAAHVSIFLLLLGQARPPLPLPPPPVMVELFPAPTPPVPRTPQAPQPRKSAPKAATAPKMAAARPAPARPAAAHATVRPAPPDVPTRPGETASGAGTVEGLSDAQLAGAAVAGGGAPGGGCDMVRQVQNALRRDSLVQAEMAGAMRGSAGRAIMVWNGDWVQGQGEDGRGLAAVREAIIWEVGFSPAACRALPVRGLVLLSLNGSARLALGAGQWRWSDLLRAR